MTLTELQIQTELRAARRECEFLNERHSRELERLHEDLDPLVARLVNCRTDRYTYEGVVTVQFTVSKDLLREMRGTLLDSIHLIGARIGHDVARKLYATARGGKVLVKCLACQGKGTDWVSGSRCDRCGGNGQEEIGG